MHRLTFPLLLLIAVGLLSVGAFGGNTRWLLLIGTALMGGVAFWQERRGVFGWRQVLLWGVVIRLLLLPLPPLLSDDVYRYLWDGLVTLGGESPYAFVPSEAPVSDLGLSTELLGKLNSQEFFSVYPPVSQIVFAVGAFFGGGEGRGILAGTYAIKLLLGLCELAALLAVVRLTKGEHERRLSLYAWNPLIVMETWGQAHGEAITLALLAWTVVALGGTRNRLAVGSLTLSVWNKLHPVLLFPLLVVGGVRWRAILWAVPLSILLWLPFIQVDSLAHIIESIGLYTSFYEFNGGPYLALKSLGDYLLTGSGALGGGGDSSKLVSRILQFILIGGLPILYAAAARGRWDFATAASAVYALIHLTSPTVHPWYLLPIVLLEVVRGSGARGGWAWLFLGCASMGTYLFYTAGSAPYLAAVWIGWGGWFLLAWWEGMEKTNPGGWVERLVRWRARQKLAKISHALVQSGRGKPCRRLLDLGAAEGFVGEAILEGGGADEVILADVLELNRTALPHHLLDGGVLPFADAFFDRVVLSYVLHHSEDSKALLEETLRVCRGEVVVLESTYRSAIERCLLKAIDIAVNRLRSKGTLCAQEEFLDFRQANHWRDLAKSLGGRVLFQFEDKIPVFRTTTLVITRSQKNRQTGARQA